MYYTHWPVRIIWFVCCARILANYLNVFVEFEQRHGFAVDLNSIVMLFDNSLIEFAADIRPDLTSFEFLDESRLLLSSMLYGFLFFKYLLISWNKWNVDLLLAIPLCIKMRLPMVKISMAVHTFSSKSCALSLRICSFIYDLDDFQLGKPVDRFVLHVELSLFWSEFSQIRVTLVFLMSLLLDTTSPSWYYKIW